MTKRKKKKNCEGKIIDSVQRFTKLSYDHYIYLADLTLEVMSAAWLLVQSEENVEDEAWGFSIANNNFVQQTGVVA